LYKAAPNGCQHRVENPAEAKTLPYDGALALVMLYHHWTLMLCAAVMMLYPLAAAALMHLTKVESCISVFAQAAYHFWPDYQHSTGLLAFATRLDTLLLNAKHMSD